MSRMIRGLMALSCLGLLTWSVNFVTADRVRVVAITAADVKTQPVELPGAAAQGESEIMLAGGDGVAIGLFGSDTLADIGPAPDLDGSSDLVADPDLAADFVLVTDAEFVPDIASEIGLRPSFKRVERARASHWWTYWLRAFNREPQTTPTRPPVAVATTAVAVVTTTVRPVATTAAPVTTTTVRPVATTAAPVTTTTVRPVATTAAPVTTTTVRPVATTAPPVTTTTVRPVATTTVPVVTTAPTVTTTTVRPVTTTVPVVTTTAAVGGGNAPAGAIQLRPGDNVASIVSGAAPGATFWFTAGTYTGLQIVPKANQVFLGASGAVLAGNGKAFAFRSSAASVTIKGLTLEGYRPASKNGVIDGADGARDWTVSNNVIRNNGEVGIRIGNGWKVIGNNIHHNGRYGIMGSGTNVVIENNEIAYNANEYGASGDSSGTKFVHTVNLVLRGNYAHHNSGNGLWVDINNLNAVIENNRSIANSRNGIFLEISCGGIIRNNYLEGNGTDEQYPNWMGNATGIQVSMTPDVQVYGNTLVNNAKGIGAIHWDHANVGNVTKCEPELRNLRVYNNSITQNGGAAAGIDAGIEQSQVYGTWDNQFYSNTYSLSGGASYRYEGNWINQQQWTSEGMG